MGINGMIYSQIPSPVKSHINRSITSITISIVPLNSHYIDPMVIDH